MRPRYRRMRSPGSGSASIADTARPCTMSGLRHGRAQSFRCWCQDGAVTLDDPNGALAQFLIYLSAGMRHDMMPYVTAHEPAVVTLEDLIAYNQVDPARRMPFGQDLWSGFAPLSADLSRVEYERLAADTTKAMTDAMETAFAAKGESKSWSAWRTCSHPFYATAGYPAITVPIGRRMTRALGRDADRQEGQMRNFCLMPMLSNRRTRAHIPERLP